MSTLASRRHFLKNLGLTSAGVAAAATLSSGAEKIKQGGTLAKEEIEKLREAYDRLDRRTQFLMRAMAVLLGIDLYIIL